MTSEDDDNLLAELRRVVAEADPVPASVMAAADAAIETRHLDALLVLLIADSARAGHSDEFAAVRGAEADGDGRILLYEGGDVRIDVVVHQQAASLTLVGQVEGTINAEVLLERADRAAARVTVDDLGRFLVAGVAPGPARLRCRTPAGGTMVTEWVTL